MDLKQKIELQKLKDHNVARLEVNYSGGGDDGMIDEIEAYDIDDNRIKGLSINNDLENFFYSYICNNVEWDWINNDGGWGVLMIDLVKNDININHMQRHTENYEYTPDKTDIMSVLNGPS